MVTIVSSSVVYIWASLVAQWQRLCLPVQETCSIPGLGRSAGGGHGNPLKYSCWEIP